MTKDGFLYISDTSWSNGTITVNVDGLGIGAYTFIIYVYDSNGNLVSDTVRITVTEIVENTGSDTTSKSDKSDSNFLQFSVFLISIVSLVIIQRQKNRSIF